MELNLKENQKAQRRLLATYVNVGESDAPQWEVIGAGVEESAIEYNNEVNSVTDILGEICFKAELEYSLRLVLPMERECPAGVQENRTALDATTAWVCARGGEELPDSLGREAQVVMGYPRLEEQREGVGIYSASVLLTTTFELEEDEWN